MNSVAHRRFVVVELAFLAAGAVLCALIIGALAQSALTAPATLNLPQSTPVASNPARSLDLEALGRLLGLPTAEAMAPALTARPVIAARLLGTSVSNLPELSLANIEDLQARESGVFRVGDQLQGATVVSVERLRVVLDNQGELQVLDFARGGSLPSTLESRLAPPLVTPLPRCADGQCTLSVQEFQEVVAKVPAELSKMRWVPSFNHGTLAGWRLAGLASDAVLTRYGFAQGDVVRRVNGFELNDPARLLEVLTGLTSGTGSKTIEVELDRHGAGQRLSYRIR